MDIAGQTTEQGYARAQRYFGLRSMLLWPAKQLAAYREQRAALEKQG
jgi:hypothetical protein